MNTALRQARGLRPRHLQRPIHVPSYEEVKKNTVRSWRRFFLFMLLGSVLLYERITDQEPNWERLHAEVLSKEPAEIIKEIHESKGAGVGIYVVDTGCLAPSLVSLVKEVNETGFMVATDLADLDSYISFETHGSMVVSQLVGMPSSLVPEADIQYYQVHHYFDPFLAYYRLSKNIRGPAVVTTSMTTTSDNRILRMLMQHYINKITKQKGVAVFCAALNDGLTEQPQDRLPLACNGAWPVGHLKRTEDGTWMPHESSGLGDWVPFFAPGTSVPVILYDPIWYRHEEPSTATGSSFAAPAAAAFTARLLSVYPWMNRRDLQLTLEYIVKPEEFRYARDQEKTFHTRCLILEE